MYVSYFKRGLDIALAGIALLIISPLMLVTAIAIYLEDGNSPFFRQERVGKDRQLFELIKFRSMNVNTANIPSANASSLSVTQVGQFSRRTNIDELPQLINILQGKMSIVGPRPALPSQTELCNLRNSNGAATHKPGLTGLAQINSYDGMSESSKAEWDGKYTSTVSFFGDLSIIIKTFAYLTKTPPVY
jgi:lipopolysaccharide/colanic/teichoic acid biosynthesis glycosyltransferase